VTALRRWSLKHLARPQPGQTFLPQIDGLRFVAILGVLLYHVQGYVQVRFPPGEGVDGGPLHALFAQGYFGVPLFFAISGYIIARPFLGPEQVSLGRYFIRRLTRLEPPYFINLLLVFAAKLWFLGIAWNALWPHLLASLVYVHGAVYGTHSEVNGVAWSLEIEWQYYVLAPLFFAVVVRLAPRLRHVGLGLVTLLGGGTWAFDFADPRWQLSLLHYFGFFFAGVWVAALDEERRARDVDGRWFDLLGCLAAVAILHVLTSGRGGALLPLLTGLLLLAALRGRMLGMLLSWWPVHCVGAMCYTIYLYHFFVISAVGRGYAAVFPWAQSPTLALAGFALVAVPVVVLVCIVPYLLIERPFMRWRPGRTRLRDAWSLR
jgi:peptidoglycan/LPS O-acetylase OafA/YrhL